MSTAQLDMLACQHLNGIKYLYSDQKSWIVDTIRHKYSLNQEDEPDILKSVEKAIKIYFPEEQTNA